MQISMDHISNNRQTRSLQFTSFSKTLKTTKRRLSSAFSHRPIPDILKHQNRLKTRFFKTHIGKDQLICINMQDQSTRTTGIIYVPEQSRAFTNILTILGSAEIL